MASVSKNPGVTICCETRIASSPADGAWPGRKTGTTGTARGGIVAGNRTNVTERRIAVAVVKIVGITNRVFVGDAAVECADRDEALRLFHSDGRTQEQGINQTVDR